MISDPRIKAIFDVGVARYDHATFDIFAAELLRQYKDGDLRMLGSRDGIVTGLLKLRHEIGLQRDILNRTPKRHRIIRAVINRSLAILVRLESELSADHAKVRDAYEATKGKVP